MRTLTPVVWFAAAALLAAVVPLRAQVDIGKPIPVKTLKPPKPKLAWFHGEVTQAGPLAITVHSRENELFRKTFSYSPKVRDQMQKILEQGGYQYGDRVRIQYETGKDVALQIKGKPSGPR